MLSILAQPAAPPVAAHLAAGTPVRRYESAATEEYYTAQSLDHFASNAEQLKHTWSRYLKMCRPERPRARDHRPGRRGAAPAHPLASPVRSRRSTALP